MKLASGQVADVLVIGDSLSVRDGSYLPYLTATLQAQYGNAGAGYQSFSLWSGAAFNSGWLQGPINSDIEPHHALDGMWASFELPPSQFYSASFTAFDSSVELHYLAQPSGGSALLSIPGAGTVSLSTWAPAPVVRTLPLTFPGADKRLWIMPDLNGVVGVLGQVNRTTNPGIVVHRAANGGWGVDSFLRRDFTFDQQLAIVHPDLIMVWIGQNDQGYNRPLYRAKIDLLVDRLQATVPEASIILIGTYDSGAEAIPALVDGMRDAARGRGLGFIDLYRTAGTHEFLLSMGYLDDGVHFSPAGGLYFAQILADAWNADGSSLQVHPTFAATLNNDAGADDEGVQRCPADLDYNGVVNLNDFFTFLNAFDTGGFEADLNGNGVDLEDFFQFLNHFDQGC